MDQPIAQDTTPIFQQIKDYLVGEIAAGRWKEGDVVPSEQALVRQFGVSRMTVNRAVRELTAEQVLVRRQGSGTYVAPQKYQATLVEIRNIADEIRERGKQHTSRVLVLAAGRLIFEGSPADVTADHEVRRAYLGSYADARRA